MHIDKNPSGRQLAVFGLLWFLFFSVLGTRACLHAGINSKSIAFFAGAVLIPATGLIWHGALRRIYLLAIYATMPVGIIVSFIVFMAVYYVVVTPIGYILRLAGHDPMRRKFDRDARTYWVPRKMESESKRYFQQF
jgi:hypothetical protein